MCRGCIPALVLGLHQYPRFRHHQPAPRSFSGGKFLSHGPQTPLCPQASLGQELQSRYAELSRLTTAELLLYDDLRLDRLATGLRLEQERIRFAWVEKTVCRGVNAL